MEFLENLLLFGCPVYPRRRTCVLETLVTGVVTGLSRWLSLLILDLKILLISFCDKCDKNYPNEN